MTDLLQNLTTTQSQKPSVRELFKERVQENNDLRGNTGQMPIKRKQFIFSLSKCTLHAQFGCKFKRIGDRLGNYEGKINQRRTEPQKTNKGSSKKPSGGAQDDRAQKACVQQKTRRRPNACPRVIVIKFNVIATWTFGCLFGRESLS